MMEQKTLFEKLGGTYSQQGDYIFPDITLPEQAYGDIGVWGDLRRNYLKQHHRVIYYNLLTSCKLYPHLAEFNEHAIQMEDTLVKELSEKEGLSEQLKAEDMMAWVGKMNNLRSRVREIILSELIYV